MSFPLNGSGVRRGVGEGKNTTDLANICLLYIFRGIQDKIKKCLNIFIFFSAKSIFY